jgi:hypothetical protein
LSTVNFYMLHLQPHPYASQESIHCCSSLAYLNSQQWAHVHAMVQPSAETTNITVQHLMFGLQRLVLRLVGGLRGAQVLDAPVLGRQRCLQPLHLRSMSSGNISNHRQFYMYGAATAPDNLRHLPTGRYVACTCCVSMLAFRKRSSRCSCTAVKSACKWKNSWHAQESETSQLDGSSSFRWPTQQGHGGDVAETAETMNACLT